MRNLTERDRSVIWHPFTPMRDSLPLLEIVSARGALLTDAGGRQYLDAISSWWTNLHGHGHPELVETLREQAARLDHVLFAGCTHEPAVGLAELLVERAPLERAKVFYSDDGSTAVEVGLKLAVQRSSLVGRPRSRLVALRNAYHGDTFGAMAVGERGVFTLPFAEVLCEVRFVDPALPPDEFTASLDAAFEGEPAAFIYEPLVQGAGGMVMPAPERYERLIRRAREAGAVVIADEVMTGFGRTGRCFASELLAEKPDIICVAKGLSGGMLPLAATLVSGAVWEPFDDPSWERTFFHGHSFTANPIACACGVKSIELLERPDSIEARARIAEAHRRFAAELSDYPRVEHPRTRGTIFACEVGAAEGYLSPSREAMCERAIASGVLLRPLGNTVYLMPPYCVGDEELEPMYGVVRELAR